MSDKQQRPEGQKRANAKRLRDDHPAREALRDKIDRYLDVPLALASLLVLLIIVIQLSGELTEPWRGRVEVLGWALWSVFALEFAVKFALAPVKRRYLKNHWLDALIVLLPFLRFLRIARVLRATRAVPVFRLLVLGGRSSSSALVLLKRRRLGQLALISVIVVLIAASGVFLLEASRPDSNIENFGDALWWSATTLTTVGSGLEPVTVGGRILAFALMLYAVGIFSYFVASIASVLVGIDAQTPTEDTEQDKEGIRLNDKELETLRSILKKAERS